jgi:hypothetical protein
MVMSEGDGTHTPFDNYIESSATKNVTLYDDTQGWWGGKSNGGKRGEIATLNDPYIGQKFWPEAPDVLADVNYKNPAR